uniref:protein PML n=1 Tax=Euleptes europaea TaxID=460621 RepID=UPI00254200E6|nr:protein PML [Euleptes europaea]
MCSVDNPRNCAYSKKLRMRHNPNLSRYSLFLQGMEEEFQFLLCEKCHREPQDPKLLSCLHTLCSECVAESKPVGHCPVCRVPVPRFQDNLLFTHLQANLTTYQQIAAGKGLLCSRCKVEAEFWCSECKEFLCVRCYDAHQWYLKRNSHEAQKISDVKVDSATRFLAGAQKSCILFCSNPAHSNQGLISNIYCRQCCRPLCCSCAVLDGEHSKSYCDISVEIQQRKEELGKMSEELREKEQCYEQTYADLQQRALQLESMWKETQDLIQEKVEEMIRWIRQKGDQLLEGAEKRMHKELQDGQANLRDMERMLGRMRTGKQLVEKMSSFASDQEVMDMHPFIKQSLEELKRERMPMAGQKIQTMNFEEIRTKLWAFCRKVMGIKDGASTSYVPSSAQAHNTTPSITILRKRPLDQCEKSTQASPKMPKHEAHDSQEGETSAGHIQDAAICPPCAHEMSLERDQRVINNSDDADQSFLEVCESEVTSIVISSSDDTDAENMAQFGIRSYQCKVITPLQCASSTEASLNDWPGRRPKTQQQRGELLLVEEEEVFVAT